MPIERRELCRRTVHYFYRVFEWIQMTNTISTSLLIALLSPLAFIPNRQYCAGILISVPQRKFFYTKINYVEIRSLSRN